MKARLICSVLLVPLVLGACSSNSSRSDTGSAANRPLETPVRLTAGEYISPASAPEVRERGPILADADALKPKFSGSVNGIYIWPGDGSPEGVSLLPCAQNQTQTVNGVAALQPSPYWFEPPAYLLPGTFENSEPFGATCTGEPPFVVERELTVLPAGGDVSIAYTWQRYYATPVSVDRVIPGNVAGKPAALILPITPEGFGPAHVLVRLDNGMVRVTGNDIPLDELKKIAESVIAQVS